ncbi:hypothetical protein ACPOL_5293 [Acidisarcina polymorpha]|uniref:Uncharacterized protein n=1 Tax=Acidisarcina polymorpha TaxID=2211140 RepID=A0A2Z5G5N5_9BACT|nr:hypothetical protein ACPOL_5293 [Acidisarcina polymorpha]
MKSPKGAANLGMQRAVSEWDSQFDRGTEELSTSEQEMNA